MSLVCVFALLFAGDPTATPSQSSYVSAISSSSAENVEDSAKDVITRSRQLGVDAECLIPELVGVYQVLQADDTLSRQRRESLTGAIRYRLIKLGDRVVIRLKRSLKEDDSDEDLSAAEELVQAAALPMLEPEEAAESDSDSLAGNGYSESENSGSPGGSAEYQRAQELIELIRRTIAPQSWDVVGGQGSIYYFQPTHSLVVRQTAEVHWLIGGLRQAMGN